MDYGFKFGIWKQRALVIGVKGLIICIFFNSITYPSKMAMADFPRCLAQWHVIIPQDAQWVLF